MPTPYLTNIEADVFNVSDNGWTSLEDIEKTSALEWGRRYIDLYYTCLSFNEEDAPAYIKEANALLGKLHIDTPLYSKKPINDRIKKKTVKAGSVMSSSEYAGSKYGLIDPFPEVTMLLSESCTLQISSNTIFLQRA